MGEVIEVPPGNYAVGDDSIPNAGPRHRRRFGSSFWIDTRPVSWAHFEVFLAGGGFSDSGYWKLVPGTTTYRPNAVDARHQELLAQAKRRFAGINAHRTSRETDPITGLTWFEASAVAAYFGARLPHELEWEVAHCDGMRIQSLCTDRDQGVQPVKSKFGCEIFIGELQEWTLDVFSRVYFRVDYHTRGVRWTPDMPNLGVAIRGAKPEDLYQHISYRTTASPEAGDTQRGFRRVWDLKPQTEQVSPIWRD
ncbi:MAG: SUMF1/EgtB/PvdO family nonheme iron enzyme [Bryobacteraceae bacterium]|nr:SUMF1/EgtB/PvdO family nonheme iron enzyme [Bryobacteraceae bacterium]